MSNEITDLLSESHIAYECLFVRFIQILFKNFKWIFKWVAKQQMNLVFSVSISMQSKIVHLIKSTSLFYLVKHHNRHTNQIRSNMSFVTQNWCLINYVIVAICIYCARYFSISFSIPTFSFRHFPLTVQWYWVFIFRLVRLVFLLELILNIVFMATRIHIFYVFVCCQSSCVVLLHILLLAKVKTKY